MNQDHLDQLDDKIFNIVCELNRVMNLSLGINKMNHTDLIINIRESIIEELERQRDEHE